MDFSEVAKEWDTDVRLKRSQKIASEIETCLKTLKNKPIKRALEFGCGTGLVGLQLAPLFETLTMNDEAQGMIEVLNEKVSQLAYPQVIPVCQSVQTLLASHDAYDFIFSSMVIHHIEDVAELLGRFSQNQNVGDLICLVDLDKDFDGHFHSKEHTFKGHHGFSHEEMKAYATRAGYQVEKLYTFYTDKKQREDRESAYSLFILFAKKL